MNGQEKRKQQQNSLITSHFFGSNNNPNIHTVQFFYPKTKKFISPMKKWKEYMLYMWQVMEIQIY